jgi:two-component system alkaline phosphatase synthesis response regulator PhoP
MQKILVIEDNADTRRFLQVMLGREYQVICASNGLEGIEKAKKEIPHLILMDVVMPTLNGYDTCKQLRSDTTTASIPIIFLSGKNTSTEVTYGLSMGADDYLPKPFDHQELLLRIKSRLDRLSTAVDVVRVGKLEIKTADRQVQYLNRPIELTLTEFDLLRLLALRHGTIVSREDIMKEIWKNSTDKTKERTIDVHVRSIRKKIPEMENHIDSIYGVGYLYKEK